MCHKLFRDASLCVLLLKMDQDLAAMKRAEGCTCGGGLHTADYPRKPRGTPRETPPGYERRLSFCCAREGCRKRATPPSMRFLGRRIYVGAVVLLLSALSNGVTPRRSRRLRSLMGVSRRTLCRWRKWWCESFPETRFWRQAKARILPPVDLEDLPQGLLSRFAAVDARSGLLSALRFLLPITTTSTQQGRGI